jgi:hypothetical protein
MRPRVRRPWCAVGVVEAQVGVELASQARESGVEVAGERGAPALVEDRLVQCLDVAVAVTAMTAWAEEHAA